MNTINRNLLHKLINFKQDNINTKLFAQGKLNWCHLATQLRLIRLISNFTIQVNFKVKSN